MIFSERYKGMIFDSNGQWNDRLIGNLDFKLRRNLVEIMTSFDEPKEYKKSRYSDEKIEIGAFQYAVSILNHELGMEIINLPSLQYFGFGDDISRIASIFAPFIFDVIEYQYEILSAKEKKEFSKRLNEAFSNYNSPWIIHDGNMIKIDSCQFEMDLKNKTEALLKELKDAEPEFQPAYDELNKAIEFYNKTDYSEAIMNANKSYESVLKVFLNVARGNADKLTSDIIKKINLPSSFNPDGFKDKVLMSLPFVRNNATGHGAGAKEVIVSKELANLSINLACSLITFIVEEYKKEV